MQEQTGTTRTNERRSSIRKSKLADLNAIHAWLTDEEARSVHGNFLCNWSIIEKSHKKGKLLVYIDGATKLPIAFQLGGLIHPGILQVRQEHRGMGIGKKMVARCVALAAKRDEHLLHIECKPSTSIPFWKRMGFHIIKTENGKHYGYRIIEQPLELPIHGTNIEVKITFFPESRMWDEQTQPYISHLPKAIQTPEGFIHLDRRVFFHNEAFPDVGDVYAQIEIEGNLCFHSKAKYSEAQKIGIERCLNGFYIDKISAPN